MIGLLAVGFVANELVRPVHPRFHEPAGEAAAEPAPERAPEPSPPRRERTDDRTAAEPHRAHRRRLGLGHAALRYGVYELVRKASQLFMG